MVDRSRRRAAAVAGHSGDEVGARALLDDPDPVVRATALGALARLGRAGAGDVGMALADPSPEVRRRACQVGAGVAGVDLVAMLDDPDAGVVEVAAWALGEQAGAPGESIARLSSVATGHDDPLCREAAVAALGAIGDERGLPAILAATRDKPAIRRRAVIALAPFDGPEVHAALEAARSDRDWQVKQAAEDLSG
ncbi:MAG TPA: HEAT repeat domain-containing protein [Acidimicrobiales bacterium]|nr:HEAT repeat domain-containing protein [Acidimicrobiales bacterium]HWI03252.1 HEAT repeat domain-containing protein [Acidimicrobiales bacterium]